MNEKRIIILDEDTGEVLHKGTLKKDEIIVTKKNLNDSQMQHLKNLDNVKKYNKSLGGFVSMYYIKNELLFNEMNLALANISRLIYLSTYLSYNDKENGLLVINGKGNKLIPMTRKSMRNRLKLSEAAFNQFFIDVHKNNILYSANGKYYLNDEYFTKGKVDKEKCFTRIYIDTTRYLYENSTSRQHKQLSYVYQLLGKLHFQLNIVCFNPDEMEYDNIRKMSLIDICNFLGVSQSNKARFKRDLLKFKIDIEGYKFYVFRYVKLEGMEKDDDYFVINPNLTWKGSDTSSINSVIKALYFGKK